MWHLKIDPLLMSSYILAGMVVLVGMVVLGGFLDSMMLAVFFNL